MWAGHASEKRRSHVVAFAVQKRPFSSTCSGEMFESSELNTCWPVPDAAPVA